MPKKPVPQALALMGVKPTWDAANRRVTGFELLPAATLGRFHHQRKSQAPSAAFGMGIVNGFIGSWQHRQTGLFG